MKEQNIGRLIAILHRPSQICINKSLKELSLTSAEYLPLLALYHTEGQTQKELSSYPYIDTTPIARIIKSLIVKDFVIIEQDAQVKRCNRIFLTGKAKQQEKGIRKCILQGNVYITERLDQETYFNTYNTLLRMVDQVHKIDIAETLETP